MDASTPPESASTGNCAGRQAHPDQGQVHGHCFQHFQPQRLQSRLMRRLRTGQKRAELCDLSVSFASSNGLREAEDGGREAGASAPWWWVGSVSVSTDGQMHACTGRVAEPAWAVSRCAHARPLRAGFVRRGAGARNPARSRKNIRLERVSTMRLRVSRSPWMRERLAGPSGVWRPVSVWRCVWF